MKMTSNEDDLTGRQPHRKTTHRQGKTTSQEDNLIGRAPPTKKNIGRRTRRKTSQTDELQPNRIKISREGNIALCYVVN